MRTKDFQKRVFEACIEMLDNNIVTTVPYLLFLLIDTIIKGIYGIAYIFHFTGGKSSSSGLPFVQDQSTITYLLYAVAAYILIILGMLIIMVLTKGDSTNFIRLSIRKAIIAVLKVNNTFLMVPIQIILFQTFRLGILTSFQEEIQVYHLAIAILTLLIQISLYLFTEHFIFCFFPNR